MRKITYPVDEKVSISLTAAAQRRHSGEAAPAAIFSAAPGAALDAAREDARVPVIVEVEPGSALPVEGAIPLSDTFYSARLTPEEAVALGASPAVRQVQTKRRKTPALDHAFENIGLAASVTGPRRVTETGRGVFVGIIDSGFDLSHPAFRDANGRLRVEGLLEQHDDDTSTAFTTGDLETAWQNGAADDLPGFDADGHGTHVASIAAGSAFSGLSGIAPEARLLLVKTDFVNTDDAASWIFRKAGATPCVINMSLGHHFGAHDGTDAEERLHQRLTAAPGRAIVVSAGNERTDSIHIGGRFQSGDVQEVTFDLQTLEGKPPAAVLTLWYGDDDAFDVELVTPAGESLELPAIGSADSFSTSRLDIDLARKRYSRSSSIQTQIDISFRRPRRRPSELRGWRLRITCTRATIGRLDGWMANSDSVAAEFRSHPLREESRTLALTSTGDGCIAVASHLSRNRWRADDGSHRSNRVIGRSSPFSSVGPARDGRQKPDISAPGHYVTAALASGSDWADDDSRAEAGTRLLTLEGTSMAAPVVTGVIALLLQKRPNATLDRIREVLRQTAKRDAHTGPASWDPVYGFGKIDVQRALALI